MRLNHNIASLNIFNRLTKTDEAQSLAMSRIASGLKINSSKDDPNGLSKSEHMRIQVRGLQMAAQNAQNGVSFLQTAEGGITSITGDVQRLKQLIVQSGTAGITAADKNNIQTEINQILKDIDMTANNTQFNGVSMLNSSTPGTVIKAAVGANPDETITIPMLQLKTSDLGISGLDVTVPNSLDNNINMVSNALSKVVQGASTYGGIENRFESTYNDNIAISDSIDEAESGIRDADIATEMVEYSRDNILSQAGIALMAQTNKFPQQILNVLSNVRSQ